MDLRRLVAASQAVTATPSRNRKILILSELLAAAEPGEVETLVAFLSGTIRQGRIGVGPAAIREAAPATHAVHPTLTLGDVDRAFEGMARLSGDRLTAQRVAHLRQLFERATLEEQKFLRRLLFGELRHGALEGVLADAVAKAAGVAPETIRRAAMMAGSLEAAASAALSGGREALDRLAVRLFQPVQPMLADSADTLESALATAGDASVEMKLDGARIQVHKDGDEVRVYTRSLRDVTSASPEAVSLVRALPARSVILDGEAIALKPDGSPHPFQVTMRRFGRQRDDEALRRELPLTPLFFDCLHVDGAALIDEPLSRRLEALQASAPAHAIVPHVRLPSPAEAAGFLHTVLIQGHEGVMVKALSAPYAAGRRGLAWLKVKQARTLDLVVLAAEWGSGRRRGWLSNLHLGARDPERNGFVMLGKTFKGLTDQILAWQTEQFLRLELARDEYTVYVRPELVVEIAFNDLQESPRYPGGLALRFARVKGYRPDKAASEADTVQTVREIYRQMTGREPPPG